MNAFIKFLGDIGNAINQKHEDKYSNDHDARWVNTGGWDEKWEYRESNVKPMKRKRYVCVFEIEGDYVISTHATPQNSALEMTTCMDDLDEEIAVSIYLGGYSRIGEVEVLSNRYPELIY